MTVHEMLAAHLPLKEVEAAIRELEANGGLNYCKVRRIIERASMFDPESFTMIEDLIEPGLSPAVTEEAKWAILALQTRGFIDLKPSKDLLLNTNRQIGLNESVHLIRSSKTD